MLKPRQMVFVGRNYVEHAREMGNEIPKQPMLFLKPVSSIIREGEAIVLHAISSHIEFEGEIGLVLGARLHRATEAEAIAALSHVVAVNDVSARDLQKSDGQWARAKGLDTFCPLGEPAPAPADLSMGGLGAGGRRGGARGGGTGGSRRGAAGRASQRAAEGTPSQLACVAVAGGGAPF